VIFTRVNCKYDTQRYAKCRNKFHNGKKRKKEERERERERGKKEKKNVDAKINWLLFLREVTYTNLRARDAMARHKY